MVRYLFTLGVFIAYLYKAMMLTTNVKIEMIKLIFSYFVIVPPPPILGRDEPNSRRRPFYKLIISQNLSNRLYYDLIFLKEHSDE